jgi:hypothetical protein
VNALFVDSSVVVSAVLERGLSGAAARAISKAKALIVSRLALVETARALLRARLLHRIDDDAFASAEEDVAVFFSRCEIWEVTRRICADAGVLAPDLPLRTLDAIHVATALTARKRIPSIRLLTVDARMRDAAETVGLRLVAM